jgi:hypothetical protein
MNNTLFSFNKVAGFVFALSTIVIHYTGAKIEYLFLFASTYIILYVVMLNSLFNLSKLLNILLIYKYEIVCYFIFVLSPFLGNYFYEGTMYDNYIILIDAIFRLILFSFFLTLSYNRNCDNIWKYYFIFNVFVYLYFIYISILSPLQHFSNSSGLCVVLASIYLHSLLKNKYLRFVLFLFTVYFLYFVMMSRTQVIGYLAFHIYMRYAYYFKYRSKKYILHVLIGLFSFGIYLFIVMDLKSTNVGILNNITSGRGVIWEHYITSVWESSSIFGIGHGRSDQYSDIALNYSGPIVILKSVMESGGVHNSFIYMFISRGSVGLIALILLINSMLRRHLLFSHDFNVGIFIVSAIMMFSTGQSTVGGLTFESLLMLMSLTIPYNSFWKDNKYLYLDGYAKGKIHGFKK